LGEIKEIVTVNIKNNKRGSGIEKKFEDLPQTVKDRCKDLKLDSELLRKHMDTFWRIAFFLYREEFPQNYSGPSGKLHIDKIQPDSGTPDLIVEHGRVEIQNPPKSLNKLFKGGNLTGEGGYGKVFMSRDCIKKKYDCN